MLIVLALLATIVTFVEGTSWTVSGQVTWSSNCDWTGGDIGSTLATSAQCGPACVANSACDHFTWTSYNGGTCWLKHFGSSNPTAFDTSSGVCGWVNRATSAPATSAPSGGFTWQVSGSVTWASNCDWSGGDIGASGTTGDQCGGACIAHQGCDHFTWTSYNGGTCWFKQFGSSNPNPIAASSSVCGYLNTPSTTTTTQSPTGLSITFVNKCSATVAVGAQNVPGFTSQTLSPGQSWTLPVPTQWSTGGTVWGCYPTNSKCNTQAPEPPISVIELDASGGSVWYDISYVSGYNLPIGLVPNNNCPPLTCPTFNYAGVPTELIWSENGQNVGVFSVCKAAYDSVASTWFRNQWGNNYDNYAQLVCCAGPYDTKATCDGTAWPTASNGANYIKVLDQRCTNAYSYPYDDQKALQQCSANSYNFEFCPTPTAGSMSGSLWTSTPSLCVFLFLVLFNIFLS